MVSSGDSSDCVGRALTCLNLDSIVEATKMRATANEKSDRGAEALVLMAERMDGDILHHIAVRQSVRLA